MTLIKNQLLSGVLATLLISCPCQAAASDTSAASSDAPHFKLGVEENVSPIIAGSSNTVPEGTAVTMTMVGNLNSEVSKVGDDVVAMVSLDCKDGGKVLLPGQWCVHGTVTQASGQKRLGRDGFVTVTFDKLVSPDGKYRVPIDVSATTHESTVKAISKVVAKDTVITTKGAVIGAFTSVRFTGIPFAIATHGYSVAAGAAIGAAVGLGIGLHRKGNIMCGLPGEELHFRLDKKVVLPAFNAQALPSAMPVPQVDNLKILVENHSFIRNPIEDKSASLLRVSFKVVNNTEKTYEFAHLVVVSDHNQMYYPYFLSPDSAQQRKKDAEPNSEQEGTITFDVGSSKRKYFLVLLDKHDKEELTRVPVN